MVCVGLVLVSIFLVKFGQPLYPKCLEQNFKYALSEMLETRSVSNFRSPPQILGYLHTYNELSWERQPYLNMKLI